MIRILVLASIFIFSCGHQSHKNISIQKNSANEGEYGVYIFDNDTGEMRLAEPDETMEIVIVPGDVFYAFFEIEFVKVVVSLPDNGCVVSTVPSRRFEFQNEKPVDKEWRIRAPKNVPILVFITINKYGFYTYHGPGISILRDGLPLEYKMEGSKFLDYLWFHIPAEGKYGSYETCKFNEKGRK